MSDNSKDGIYPCNAFRIYDRLFRAPKILRLASRQVRSSKLIATPCPLLRVRNTDIILSPQRSATFYLTQRVRVTFFMILYLSKLTEMSESPTTDAFVDQELVGLQIHTLVS